MHYAWSAMRQREGRRIATRPAGNESWGSIQLPLPAGNWARATGYVSLASFGCVSSIRNTWCVSKIRAAAGLRAEEPVEAGGFVAAPSSISIDVPQLQARFYWSFFKRDLDQFKLKRQFDDSVSQTSGSEQRDAVSDLKCCVFVTVGPPKRMCLTTTNPKGTLQT
jgi:hypothetical protein